MIIKSQRSQWTPTSLKNLRELMGLSQPKFAKKFGFPIRQIHMWEQGYYRPKLYVVLYLRLIELWHRSTLSGKSSAPQTSFPSSSESWFHDAGDIHKSDS